MIDSHHHLWRLAQGPYEFPKPDDPLLYRDVLVDELAACCRAAGVDRTIVVQTSAALWETEYLLGLAQESDLVAGVVGWCNLRAGDAGAALDRLMGQGPLVGVRPMLQRHDDVSFMLDGTVDQALGEVARRGLVFDALVDARHLETIVALADRHPELSIVIDHMAKPWRSPQTFAGWNRGLAALSQRSNCNVKLSGFPFDAADRQPWHDYSSLCAALHDWFGPERLLWGTDWPLLMRHASYGHAAEAIGREFGAAEMELIGGGNARRIYRLSA